MFTDLHDDGVYQMDHSVPALNVSLDDLCLPAVPGEKVEPVLLCPHHQRRSTLHCQPLSGPQLVEAEPGPGDQVTLQNISQLRSRQRLHPVSSRDSLPGLVCWYEIREVIGAVPEVLIKTALLTELERASEKFIVREIKKKEVGRQYLVRTPEDRWSYRLSEAVMRTVSME